MPLNETQLSGCTALSCVQTVPFGVLMLHLFTFLFFSTIRPQFLTAPPPTPNPPIGVDILLNFRTGHVHDGHLVMDPKKIAAHYFEFWFWIDIIATIPFELFGALFANKSSRKAIKLVKWFKIPRLMRLGRVLKYLRQYAKFYSLIMVSFGIILMTHMFGCIFVACVNPCGQYDYDPYTYAETSTDGPCAQKNAFKVWARALHYGVTMLMVCITIVAFH